MNAKQEFLRFIDLKSDVICAYVMDIGYYDDDEEVETICLPLGHTEEQYKEFLKKLDFKYDNGYGAQNLDGIIWFKDGSWATRGEYDGSEWWEYHARPNVPGFLYPPDSPQYDEP